MFFFLNPSHGIIDVGGVCNFLSSVSSQQKSEVTDQCYSPRMDQCYSPRMDQCYSSVLQLSFIWKVKENTPLGCEGMLTQMTQKGEAPAQLYMFVSLYIYMFDMFSCYMFFSPAPAHLELPHVNWASQECCLFYPRSSLWSLDLPLFCFPGLFPSLSFSHRHSGLLSPTLTT